MDYILDYTNDTSFINVCLIKEIFNKQSKKPQPYFDVFFQIATDLRKTSNSDYIDYWYDLSAWNDLAFETTLNNYNYIIKNCIRYIIEFEIYKTENNKGLLSNFLLNAIRKYDITDAYIVIEPLLFYDNDSINEELYDILYSDEMEKRIDELIASPEVTDEEINEIDRLREEVLKTTCHC